MCGPVSQSLRDRKSLERALHALRDTLRDWLDTPPLYVGVIVVQENSDVSVVGSTVVRFPMGKEITDAVSAMFGPSLDVPSKLWRPPAH